MVKETGKIILTAGQFARCLVLNETPALLHNRFGLKTCATFSSNQKKKKKNTSNHDSLARVLSCFNSATYIYLKF